MYKKLRTLISLIPQDKLIHGITCFSITFFIIKAISSIIGLIASIIIANIITITIGYLKEKLDNKEKNNTFDKQDFIADIIGSIIGTIFAII